MTTTPEDSLIDKSTVVEHDRPSGKHDGAAPRNVMAASSGQELHAEDWVALCARAAVEQDPKKLLELVREINRLLEIRKKRLSNADENARDGSAHQD